MSESIQGVVCVAHTPFTEQDDIDWDSLERETDWIFECGADGYCTGMVSELLRLTPEERVSLTTRLAELRQARGVFVASVGAESTRQAVRYAEQAADVGCDGVMAIPPLASALPEQQLLDYFDGIARAIDVPLIVQDASGYVGEAIPLTVYLQLLERFGPQRILFKPEKSPVGEVVTALRLATDGAARVFDGSGGNLLIDSYRRGICGTIPGAEFLDAVVAVWSSLQSNDEEAAYRVYFPLCALVTLQLQAGLDGFLAIEKYLLKKRGIFVTDARRRPYGWSLDAETQSEVDRLLSHLERAVRVD